MAASTTSSVGAQGSARRSFRRRFARRDGRGAASRDLVADGRNLRARFGDEPEVRRLAERKVAVARELTKPLDGARTDAGVDVLGERVVENASGPSGALTADLSGLVQRHGGVPRREVVGCGETHRAATDHRDPPLRVAA